MKLYGLENVELYKSFDFRSKILITFVGRVGQFDKVEIPFRIIKYGLFDILFC